jgi:hypothetical protein
MPVVAVRVYYRCPGCRAIVPALSLLERPKISRLLHEAIDDGGIRATFGEPVVVRLVSEVEPSIRPGTPESPISEIELEKARRLLQRTSFRRSSAGWKTFLRRLLARNRRKRSN